MLQKSTTIGMMFLFCVHYLNLPDVLDISSSQKVWTHFQKIKGDTRLIVPVRLLSGECLGLSHHSGTAVLVTSV